MSDRRRLLPLRIAFFVVGLVVAMVAVPGTVAAEDQPAFNATPVDGFDGVWGCGWGPSTTLSIIVDDPATVGDDYTFIMSTDPGGCFGTPGDLWDFDLKTNDIVAVTDGTATKTLVITNLSMGLDAYEDRVWGHATPGREVGVLAGAGNVNVDAGPDGYFEVDFTGVTDIQHGVSGAVIEFDPDGDATTINWTYWTPYEPFVSVHYDSAPGGSVHALDWPAGRDLDLEVTRNGVVVYAETMTATGGEDEFSMIAEPHASPETPFVVEAGDEVSVTNGARTKTHLAFGLSVDAVDYDDDRVHGFTDDPTVEVCVDVWTTELSQCVMPDPSGTWIADFSGIGPDDPIPLDWSTDLAAWQYDSDGDSTEMNNHRIPAPQISANLEPAPWINSWISGQFTPGSTVTITVDDPAIPGTPDQTYLRDAPVCLDDPECDPGVYVYDVALAPGFVITGTDGFNTKTHTVIALTLTEADLPGATVTGMAPQGTPMGVFAHSYADEHGVPVRWPTVDLSDVWVADYSVPGPDVSEQQVIPSFGPGDHFHIIAWEDDGDGDSTDLRLNTSLGDIVATPTLVEVDVDQVVVTATLFEPGDMPVVAASIDWGDSTVAAMDVVPPDEVGGNIGLAASHTYSLPGVYSVRIEATYLDSHTETDVYRYVVAYDPDGGFVTGGGSLWSPPGAYLTDPEIEGEAGFGFVAKYKKGATVPDGHTVFRFSTADLHFHSSDYEWLVVTGSDYGRFKGTGTVNGQGAYRFLIWAGDGTGEDGSDTFRIKLWEEDEFGVETVVYDNGFDQPIHHGNIVVHTKKM